MISPNPGVSVAPPNPPQYHPLAVEGDLQASRAYDFFRNNFCEFFYTMDAESKRRMVMRSSALKQLFQDVGAQGVKGWFVHKCMVFIENYRGLALRPGGTATSDPVDAERFVTVQAVIDFFRSHSHRIYATFNENELLQLNRSGQARSVVDLSALQRRTKIFSQAVFEGF